MDFHEKAGIYIFTVTVYLDGFDPETVQVQLYADSRSGKEPEIHPMIQGEEVANYGAGCYYRARIPARRSAGDYTPRIIPAFDGALVPIEANFILWYR